MGQIAITKNSTIIIKGVAILFMIAHHILIKEFYVEPDSFLNSFFALRLQIGMKTCVGIFTFILGYGFFFNRKYDAKYVISHMRRVLLRYWLVLLFTIFIASGEISPNILAHNLLGVMHQYNLGNWYIYFYIYALLVLPIIKQVFHKNCFQRLFILVVICGGLTYFNVSTNIYLMALRECTRYTSLLAIGFVCAKSGILSGYSIVIKSRLIWLLIAVLVTLFRCCISGAFGIVADVLTVPVFIIAISGTFQGLESHWFAKLFTRLGLVSAMMWFVHALPFSSATRTLFQTSNIWTNNVVMLFLCVTLSSYLIAIFFESVFQTVSKISYKNNINC